MNPPAFPTDATATLTLQGPAGALETIVEAAEAPERDAVAIVCHPLPTDGGTMHNKVVTMAARALRESGIATVRFNFRGTGASEGSFDQGRGEADDLRAVAAWVREQRPGARLWLAGFSFGSYVTLKCANELHPGMVISIAPPAAGRNWDFSTLTPPQCPWLVIQGEEDEIVDPQAVYAWIDSLKLDPPPELVKMPETSHFFHRRLMDLRGAIKNGIRPHLPPETEGAASA
ncbi:alpha/beta hydrolase [Lysobacter soli]|uniref:alpha/beta hydrolase n=1 Tax=Lysobacter soli TaxID=453783 RepID=UPI0037C5F005